MQSTLLKKNLLLLGLLVITTITTIIGVRYFIFAKTASIPAGYSVLSYFNALETADKNSDGYINAVDSALTIKRYGSTKVMAGGQFGNSVNALERSFQIENLNLNVATKKKEILVSEENKRRYAQDLVVANESLLAVPAYVKDDKVYNQSSASRARATSQASAVTGFAETTSGDSAGDAGSGSKGADSGKTVIPSVLGTVSPYTGSAGFDYPIAVPAGPGGIAPALSLSYSSGSVDDTLPYDDKYAEKQRDSDGTVVNTYTYKNKTSYVPFYAGYGFNIGGAGSIVRDTRQEKNVYVIKGDIHHRFLLNLPSGLSVELKYNNKTRRWVSIPEGFVKIDHAIPAVADEKTSYGDKEGVPASIAGKTMPGSNFKLVDSDQWVITTSDGSKYYFGEPALETKLKGDGAIGESENRKKFTASVERKLRGGDTEKYEAKHHDVTLNGGIYNEFDIADICTGGTTGNPCDDWKNADGKRIKGRFEEDKPVLLTTKWLLRRMETSDGRSIDYKYDNYSKFYGEYYPRKWENNLSYAVTDSYLKEISWNENKHRVVLTREDRPDISDRQFTSMQRLSKIDVQTKLQADDKFHTVRRYELGYVNDDKAMEPAGGRNEWGASLLSSIQEYGTDADSTKTTTPAVKFQYKAYGFEDGPSGSTIYLSSIFNGYGGETKYAYQPFTYPLVNGAGDVSRGPRRLRVIEKKVVDKTSTPNKSFRETYNYKDANGNESSWGFADRVRGETRTGREFLGHSQVEIKSYDFDSDKVLSHSKTQFYQFNAEIVPNKPVKRHCVNGECEETTEPGFACFEPHMNKGRPRLEIVYNQLPGGGKIEASRTEVRYNYRTLAWDAANNGAIKEDKLNVESKKCDGIGMAQPYFVYAKDTISTVTEPFNAEFNKTGVLTNLKETPVNTKTVRSENLAYDLFGNLLQSVSYGEVDAKGNDIDAKDNRYSFGYYLTGNPNWLNNLAYVTYASNQKDCAPGNFACQYGRSEMWYDRFYVNQPEVKIWEQKPVLGLLTQTKSFIETDANRDNKHDDPIVAYGGTEYLRLSNNPADQDSNPDNDTTDQRRGGPIKMYGPKPNLTSVNGNTLKDIAGQIALLSQTKYDDYYHTLVQWTENALGHRTQLEDYDYLLQVPRKRLTQISKDPVVFSASRVEFDPLGRAVASFGPHPADPSKTLDYPQSISAQFDDRGDAGLATRQLALVSQTNDGTFHYVASDSFYDGMGKVKQTQVLSKKVKGTPKRIVSDAVYNAAGQQLEQFEVQEAEAITLPRVTNTNYKAVIRLTPPALTTIPHTVVSRSVFDGLNRPVQSTVLDLQNKTELVSRTAYYVNAQKAINPKGVVTIATTDSLGRPSDALVIDPTGDQHSLTQNVYEQAMLDKPTKTTYKSLKNLEGGSVATTMVSYDKGGRIISSDEPSLGKSSFTYDVLGNVMSMRRANQETRSEFDILGRLIKTSYVNGSSELFNKVAESKSNIDYVYDTAPYALGKLTSISHHMGKDEFTYDNQGRQKTVKKTIGSKTYSTTNSYNALSQISKVEYPDNHVYTANYDEEGVAQKSTLNGKELAQSTIFDKFGNVYESQFVLGANTYVSRTPHDAMGRISQIGFAKKSGTTETPYFFQQLNYDANAQLSPLTEITFKDGVEARTDYTYTYDSFARLVKADSSKFNTSYSYDPFGRITAKNENEPITYAYNDTFPFFAPKSISMPVESAPESPIPTIVQTLPTLIPTSIETQSTKTFPSATPRPSTTPRLSVTPTSRPRLSSTPTPTKRPTSAPLPTLRVTAGVTLIPIPTSAPMSCMFEPIAAIKEELADKTLRTLTSEEAANFLTINDKRKAKYDVDSTKKEFWNTFVDGFLKSCPAGGCDMKDKELCCVDEKNELPYAYKVGEKGFTGKIQPLIARATITLKDFTTGTKKYDVLRKYCTNMEGADGCPPDTEEIGGLREQGVPVTEIRNIQIGCNKRYEYGWIVKKVNPIEAFLRRFLPSDRGIADEQKVPAPAPKGTTNFRYNTLGAMLEDNKQCYTYNRLNQLISMKIKKTSGVACSSAEFIKTIYFYYDYAGTLVLQEEFKPNTSKPSKQIYYFGAYEDEYSEE